MLSIPSADFAVETLVAFLFHPICHVGVYRGAGDVFMSELLLDIIYVGSVDSEVCSEAVAEYVRGDVLIYTGLVCVLMEELPDPAWGYPPVLAGYK